MKRLAYAAAWLGGFAVMGAELAAGRLVAPYFGTSTPIWATLIGAVLSGLAVGSLLGGRLARQPRALEVCFAGMALAGLVLGWLPSLTRPLMRSTLDDFLRGGLLQPVLGLLGLGAALLLPVVLLGAISPVLVHTIPGDRDHVGLVAGRLGALGTFGSLTGTFLSGIVLVPLYGTELCFRVFGALCILLGVCGVVVARRQRRWLAAATLGVLALCVAPRSRVHTGPPALYEAETAYNHLRVVDHNGLRALYLNEGYAVQTLARLDGKPVLHGVWGYYALAPAYLAHRPSRVLIIGLGGGTSARRHADMFPEAEVVGVELDAGVAEVARRHFDLPARVEVHVQDARTFLAADDRHYDLVVLDAFQFPYVPFQLTTQEFFTTLRARITDGGALMVNVGRKADHLDVVHAVATTLGTVFARVDGVNVPHTTNSLLLARDRQDFPHDPRSAEPSAAPPMLGIEGLGLPLAERRQLEALQPLRPWQVPPGADVVLTDDRAPIEWLTNRILARELLRMWRS